MSKTLAVLGIGLFSFTTPPSAFAQATVTLLLRSGDRQAGALVDLAASDITLRSEGRDRRFAADEVAVLEFVSGDAPRATAPPFNRGPHIIALRNGQAIEGRLVGLRGSVPLRVLIATADGPRDVSSMEIAQVFLAPVSAVRRERAPVKADDAQRAASASARGVTPSVVRVQAAHTWTDTGLTVARGERLLIRGTGSVTVSAHPASGPEGSRAATSEATHYPVAGAPAGALIARVGEGTPFAIDGGSRVVQVPNPGRLQLGVNDDDARDNSGTFTVTITRQGR